MKGKPRPAIGARLSGLVAGVDMLGQPAATTLSTGALRPGQFQPRVTFAQDALDELSRSIAAQGVLQPLLVRPVGSGAYEIVAGERRWRAAQQAGLTEVPVLIRDLNDHEARLAAAVENLQRQNLNVVEEVRARLQVAAATLGVGEDEAVARMFALDRQPEQAPELVAALDQTFGALGRETWRSFIRNRAPILRLPQDVQSALRGGLDYRKALVIGRADNAAERADLIALAHNGATVQTLRAHLQGPARPAAEPRAHLARQLTDRAAWTRLDAERRRKAERLIAQLQALLAE